jgi:hypothetical protein
MGSISSLVVTDLLIPISALLLSSALVSSSLVIRLPCVYSNGMGIPILVDLLPPGNIDADLLFPLLWFPSEPLPESCAQFVKVKSNVKKRTVLTLYLFSVSRIPFFITHVFIS